MNIFYLDQDPDQAARSLCNKHVVKMIVESAQMLSTTHWCITADRYNLPYTRDGWWQLLSIASAQSMDKLRTQFGKDFASARKHLAPEHLQDLYAPTHVNHPSNIWVRSHAQHYNWLTSHALSMCDEYTQRYNKTHKTQAVLEHLHTNIPRELLFDLPWQDPPQCMPDECKVPNQAVQAYRKYYKQHKAKFAKWPADRVPAWW